MAIGSKGQFYLITVVFMLSIAIGLAYFTAESKQLEQQSEIEPEPILQSLLAGYSSELQESLSGGFFAGNNSFYLTVGEALTNHSAEKGYLFSPSCTRTAVNDYSATLECDLGLSSETGSASTGFSISYEVPFETALYADVDLTEETYSFGTGETVYYRLVTNNNSLDVNVSVFYPNGTRFSTGLDTPVNFAVNNSFALTADAGDWWVETNNTVDFFNVTLGVS